MPGNHRRVLFLAAEAAAGFGLHDAHFVVGQTEQHLQRAVHVVRTLHRSVHRYGVVRPRHGDDAVGLDVQLLLMTGSILALDDHIGAREAFRDVALHDRGVLERRRGPFGVVVRRRRAVVDVHVGGEERVAIGVREQQNRLRDVADLALGERGLIIVDQRDDVSARNVGVADNGEP